MPRLVRNQTLDNLEDAYLDLRDRLAEVAPTVLDDSPAQGCCGCGSPMADVRSTEGEGYDWRCVRRLGFGPGEYVVLPGRER